MKKTFRALTSLRFFAAIAVVFFHYAGEVRGFGRIPFPLKNLVHRGPLALCFFFVLSGFVLSISYQDKAIKTAEARRRFWFARFARLYPAYLLAFVLFLPMALQKYLLHPAPELGASGPRTFAAGAILSPLLLQSWTTFSQAWNGPGWSLSVEAFFYFLFPYVAFRLMRQQTSVALTIPIALWVASLCVVLAHLQGHLSNPIYHDRIQYNPLFWTPCFVAGIVTAGFAPRWQKVSAKMAGVLTISSVAALVLICLFVSPRYEDVIVTTGLLPLLALVILCCSHESARVVALLGSSPLYELGEVSYITYILQSPLWHAFSA
ncbi:MAG TPA: acyltransferase, partial [Acidobacteriaceae bacterium]|nr:acyltransferase [Acidobacteriaceae bacterium]